MSQKHISDESINVSSIFKELFVSPSLLILYDNTHTAAHISQAGPFYNTALGGRVTLKQLNETCRCLFSQVGRSCWRRPSDIWERSRERQETNDGAGNAWSKGRIFLQIYHRIDVWLQDLLNRPSSLSLAAAKQKAGSEVQKHDGKQPNIRKPNQDKRSGCFLSFLYGLKYENTRKNQ